MHEWNLTPKSAIALQRDLAAQIRIEPLQQDIHLIAGSDVSFSRRSSTLYAAVVVCRMSDMTLVETAFARVEARFPYVPGLLSFREAPAVLAAWQKLQTRPDALMVDGQGLAHPRRFGLACHLGLWLDLPTLGCAKSLLVGSHRTLPDHPGATVELTDRREQIGTVLRSKARCHPLYISPGHRLDSDDAVRIVMKSLRGYRLPEPTRLAHQWVNQQHRTS